MDTRFGIVSLVIINFNSGRYLPRCLSAIEAQTYPHREVIIVDNGSTDGSTAGLRELAADGRIRLFEGANVGSSKANNLGIRDSSGEFVLILNADAFLEPSYLEECVRAMRENEQVGTAVGKLVSASDPSIIDSAGLYFYREGLPIDRGFGEKDAGQYQKVEFVDGACCAAALYRRSMLEAIRLRDEYYREDFFAFTEDIELSFRSTLHGWKTIYLPQAIAHHVRGGSSQSLSEFTFYLNERNLRAFLKSTFNQVARRSDIWLQSIVLFFRTINLRRKLSPAKRASLKSEIQGLMQQMTGEITPIGLGHSFDTRGRRSYLGQAIKTRVQSML